jgi:hypothetical protein
VVSSPRWLASASSGAEPAEVRSQVQAILVEHQFVGLLRLAVADFFDA